jgi:hypothetical protein
MKRLYAPACIVVFGVFLFLMVVYTAQQMKEQEQPPNTWHIVTGSEGVEISH